jgi:zinc protease
MKLRYIITFLLILLYSTGLMAQGTGTEGAKLVEKLKFPEIKWDVPELGKDVIVDTLDNGIVLFMMEDPRLPVLNIRGIVRTGSMYDPSGLEGLASMTGEIIRSGGTKTMEPDSLNAILEYHAASVETWIGNEQGSVSMNCLSKDVDRVMTLFADVIMNPEFRQDKIDLSKDDTKESILRRNDSPRSITSREFSHLIYDDHFYGWIQEWESIDKIQRQNLIDFHKKYFVPNNLWLGITGDFKMADIKKQINDAFAGWEPQEIDYPEKPMVKKEFNPGVYLIDKDLSQSSIRFGLLGVKKDNPDRYAISVMNYILGGGSFTSRMTTIVRSDMGLAYSVGSRFGTGSRDIGTFYSYCQTKTETTYKAVYNMLDQVKTIANGKVTDYELESARDSYINRYVFNFTNPSSIVSQLMGLEYDNRPRDFYKNYISNLQAVTANDVLRVAKEYLKPEKMTFLIVGNSEGFDGDMSEFGKINYIELKEPIIE